MTSFRTESRVVGFDDAPFTRDDAEVPVVGVVMRGGRYVEAVLRTQVTRDGDDATERLAAAVAASPQRENLTALLLQNWTVGGFNVIDLDGLHAATSLPVLAVARGTPDFPAVRTALAHVPNGDAKWERVQRVAARTSHVANRNLTLAAVGLDVQQAHTLLELTTVRGHLPEPLRLAHLIGAGWVLGRSKGQ